MSWKIIITASAKKQLRRLPKSDFYRASSVIDQLKINPFNFSNLVKLSDKEEARRVRIGSYRVKFELFQKEKAVFVYEVKRRTSTTY